MNFKIRPFETEDIEAIVELSLLAWEAVFESFANVLGSKIFPIIYPDWRTGQADVVSQFCQDREKYFTYVAEDDGVVVGFINYELNQEKKEGEVMLLAVKPDDQNRGVGTKLNFFALQKMIAAGMKLAVVGTGGDAGHAPARRSYEKAGYTPLPLVRYYQDLPAGCLVLRPVNDADLPFFFEFNRDPVACQMAAFTAEDPNDRAGFDAHWAKIQAHEGVTIRTILWDGLVAGSILIHNWFGDWEVSYWVGREFWGQGIATQALTAFLEEIKTRPLNGRAAADNIGSIRVLEKCGFEDRGTDRGFANARGEEIDEVILVLK
jgi:RimJ/RimL family protein N-acetyltransferase